jgi:LuxR family transcriptional regulator, maltose regulon positive regulatory protein
MSQGIAYQLRGQPAKAEQVFAAVRKLVDSTGKTWLQPFEMAYSAASLSLRGKLQESASLTRQIVRAAGDQPSEVWVQAALCDLGKNYLEWNLLDDAERTFRRALDLAEMTGALHWRSRIQTGLARIAWARGDHEHAHDEIELAIGSGGQANTQLLVRNARAWQARFWLASRQIALARRWADSCELDPYLPPEYERYEEQLTYVRLLLRQDRPDLTLRILERIQTQAREDNRYGDLVEIYMLTALAHKACENTADAIVSLQNALEFGGPGGYLRVFLDESDGLEHLLRYVAARGSQRDYAQHILSAMEGAPATIQHIGSARSNGPDALSEREAEVLRLVAVGLSNRDIGERLFISEKTVKTHLSNILGKLGAANRTQAVEQAHRMGLF